MEDVFDFHQECGRQDPGDVFNDSSTGMTVLEVKRDNTTRTLQYQKCKLSSSTEKKAWLNETNTPQQNSAVLQLLQVTLQPESYSNHRYLDISKEDYDAVVKKFGLSRLCAYGISAMQSFNQVSEQTEDGVFTYSTFHIQDYIMVVSKHDSRTGPIQGICCAGKNILPFLERAIFHLRALAGHPSFLNVCLSLSFDVIIDSRLSLVSDELARIERRTGFKVWSLEPFAPAHGDPNALSATATGYATSLAANRRLNRLSETILRSVEEVVHSSSSSNTAAPTDHKTRDNIAARVKLLLQRNETQRVLIEFLLARLQNQLTALFNIITQTDARVTISIARDSKTIATASKHDSSSMKALAGVTALFLPGTFISSLFSTSMFDWQAGTDGSVVNRRFWVFWAITLPLTAVTVAVWLVWARLNDAARGIRERHHWRSSEKMSSVGPEIDLGSLDKDDEHVA